MGLLSPSIQTGNTGGSGELILAFYAFSSLSGLKTGFVVERLA